MDGVFFMKILRMLVCYCLCICVFWWCVAFRDICTGAFCDNQNDTAVGSGFESDTTGQLKQGENYEIRFYFLELLDRLQNFLFRKQ